MPRYPNPNFDIREIRVFDIYKPLLSDCFHIVNYPKYGFNYVHESRFDRCNVRRQSIDGPCTHNIDVYEDSDNRKMPLAKLDISS